MAPLTLNVHLWWSNCVVSSWFNGNYLFFEASFKWSKFSIHAIGIYSRFLLTAQSHYSKNRSATSSQLGKTDSASGGPLLIIRMRMLQWCHPPVSVHGSALSACSAAEPNPPGETGILQSRNGWCRKCILWWAFLIICSDSDWQQSLSDSSAQSSNL